MNVVHRRADVELTVVRVLVQSRTPTGDNLADLCRVQDKQQGPKTDPCGTVQQWLRVRH